MTAPEIDIEQARRLLGALYEDGDTFHLLAVTEKGSADFYSAAVRQKISDSRTGRHAFLARHQPDLSPGLVYSAESISEAAAFIKKQNSAKFQVAASVGAFAPGLPKLQQNCVGLSAFAIDIDSNDFAALVPGAAQAVDVVGAVRAKLAGVGLAPHALVLSGHGLHVYLLIERVTFTDNAERTRAKEVWWRLGHLLGGSQDRFDLASMMRVPGTFNWKNGDPKPVQFLAEYTDLDRVRYRFEAVADALAALPPLPKDKAVGAKRKAARRAAHDARPEGAVEHGHADDALLEVALELDPKLKKAREACRSPETADHSEADFTYACRMLEVGLPESVIWSELDQGIKAQEHGDADDYIQATLSGACNKVWGGSSRRKTAAWAVYQSSEKALYTSWKAIRNSPSPCGTSAAPSESMVRVVMTRPGHGKTRDLVEALAQRAAGKGDRTGLVAPFTGELLRHEFAINNTFPAGFPGPEAPFTAAFSLMPSLPTTHEQVWELLAAEVKAHWTLDQFRTEVRDPTAFWINSMHPEDLDARLEPQYEASEDGTEDRPIPPSTWKATTPAAVLKFRGNSGLCLAHHDEKVLSGPHPPCSSTCTMTSCRANTCTSADQRGAKTYWRQAAVPLLTHRAFEVQALVRPEGNDFKRLVIDELPQSVFRHSRITVTRRTSPKCKTKWQVEPLDSVCRVLAEVGNNVSTWRTADRDFYERIMAKLDRERRRLTQIANKRRKSVEAETAVAFERMADTRPPLLSTEEFEYVVTLTRERLPRGSDLDENDNDQTWQAMLDALEVLRDFSGDEPELDVYLEHGFRDGIKHPSLWLYRPVDGWNNLLRDRHHRDRSVVLMDATAGIDPRYLLRGQFQIEGYPDGHFPNTTVVLTSAATVSKSKRSSQTPNAIVDEIVAQVRPYLSEIAAGGLLVVAPMELEGKLRPGIEVHVASGSLPANTALDHFGALRGRNDYRDFDAVFFTNTHRYEESYYISLGLLLHGFRSSRGQSGIARQWKSKNAWEDFAPTRARGVIADMYQDAMRIGLRQDTERRAFIFVPTAEAEYVIRLMRLLPGATFRFPDGKTVLVPSEPPRTGKGEVKAVVEEVSATAPVSCTAGGSPPTTEMQHIHDLVFEEVEHINRLFPGLPSLRATPEEIAEVARRVTHWDSRKQARDIAHEMHKLHRDRHRPDPAALDLEVVRARVLALRGELSRAPRFGFPILCKPLWVPDFEVTGRDAQHAADIITEGRYEEWTSEDLNEEVAHALRYWAAEEYERERDAEIQRVRELNETLRQRKPER